jgi:hypothetical protein
MTPVLERGSAAGKLKRGKRARIRALNAQIHGLTALTARAEILARLGQQYGGDRDVYEALGYKTTLTYQDYAAKYYRLDIASAVINRPIEATWQGKFKLLESTEEEDTPLEKAWKELELQHSLTSKFIRLDKLASIGKYGVLLLGLDDVKDDAGMAAPVVKGLNRKLLYVKPLSEGSAGVSLWEGNPKNPRYGLPTLYNVTVQNAGSASGKLLRVHHSRVVHVVIELLESEAEGIPALQSIFNRLDDLEKIVGGSGEMFWRGARPGYQAEIDPEFDMTPEQEKDLQDQLDEYEHNLRRVLVNTGVTFSPLATQIADPTKHFQIQLQAIAAAKDIPLRVLMGNEIGELASTQDRAAWLDSVKRRRGEVAENRIVRPVVNRFIEYDILPPAESPSVGYRLEWQDPYAPSEKDKAEIGRSRAEAVRAYTNNPGAEAVVSPTAFIQFFLGLSEEDAARILSLNEEFLGGEVEIEDIQDARKASEPEPAPAPAPKPKKSTKK